MVIMPTCVTASNQRQTKLTLSNISCGSTVATNVVLQSYHVQCMEDANKQAKNDCCCIAMVQDVIHACENETCFI